MSDSLLSIPFGIELSPCLASPYGVTTEICEVVGKGKRRCLALFYHGLIVVIGTV